MTRAQLFGAIVPDVLAVVGVGLAGFGLWIPAGLLVLASIGAVIWSRRLIATERADHAIADSEAVSSDPDEPGVKQ